MQAFRSNETSQSSRAAAVQRGGGAGAGSCDPKETTFEVTPLKVGSMLYLCTPHGIAIALDAATGKERWRFDPKTRSDTAASI